MRQENQKTVAQQPALLSPRRTHHQRIDRSQLDSLATAIEALTTAIVQTSFNNPLQLKLMNYEEAEIATGLKRSKLESMVKSGRFREGRHYIKEGTRILFHYNLIDLMFEDKLLGSKNIDPDLARPPATPEPTKTNKPVKPGRNQSAINLNYARRK